MSRPVFRSLFRPVSRRLVALVAVGASLGATALVVVTAPVAQAATTAAPVNPALVYEADVNGDGASTGISLRSSYTGAVTVLRAEDTTITNEQPALSPDGERVAFSTGTALGTGDTESIWLISKTGSGACRVIDARADAAKTKVLTAGDTVVDTDVSWSPDGTTLYFSRLVLTPTTATQDLHRVPATCGATAATAIPVPAGYDATDPVPSPDGLQLAFTLQSQTQPGDPAVWLATTAGASPHRLVTDSAAAAWSPDSTRIAYETRTAAVAGSDVYRIGVVHPDGTAATTLGTTQLSSVSASEASSPSWAADGRAIYFSAFLVGSAGPGTSDLYAVSYPAGQRVRLTTTAGNETAPNFRGPVPPDVVSGTRSMFTGTAPVRILRTLATSTTPATPVGPGGVRDVLVTGLFTPTDAPAFTVPANATAVVLNVTSVNATAATDIRVYPTPADASFPPVSNINVQPRQSTPNLVTVAVGVGGKVRLRNTAGTTDLLADLAGYFAPPSSRGALFTPSDPKRILHTGSGYVGPTSQAKIGVGGIVDLPVTGTLNVRGGGTVTVPADATAVVLNVTAFNATAATDIRVYPSPGTAVTFPGVSNLNVPKAGVTVANLVVVKVGVGGIAGGKVRLRNTAGATDLAADLAGWYGPSGGTVGAVFVPVQPQRLLSTVYGIGRTGYDRTPLSAGGVLDGLVTGARAVPAGAVAVTLNVTGVGATTGTDLRAYPTPASGTVYPGVSNLNLQKGASRANLATVKVGAGGAVRVRNSAGTVGTILDLSGYYLP